MQQQMDSELEQKMLNEMDKECGVESNTNLSVAASENINPDVLKSPKLNPIPKNIIPLILKQIEGVTFKFGEAYFKITYINEGQNRFSAELINPVTFPVDLSKVTTKFEEIRNNK